MASARVSAQRELAKYVRMRTRGGREMVDYWLHLLRGDGPYKGRKVSEDLRFQASVELANRAFGKPVAAKPLEEQQEGPQVLFIPFRAKELPTATPAEVAEAAEVVVREARETTSASDG